MVDLGVMKQKLYIIVLKCILMINECGFKPNPPVFCVEDCLIIRFDQDEQIAIIS